jgi:hypothetical protein
MALMLQQIEEMLVLVLEGQSVDEEIIEVML